MYKKRNNKESRLYVQGLRQFIRTIPKNAKTILKKDGHNFTEIVNKWKNIAGNEMADSCYPKLMKRNPDDNSFSLILSVKRGNEVLVEFSKKRIIDKVNSYFGYRYINNIRLESSNSELKEKKMSYIVKNPEKFIKKIKKIKNKKLQESFIKLINVAKNG